MRTFLLGLMVLPLFAQTPDPLVVCATTPDLQSIAAALLGTADRVQSLATGPQDPHFLEARPSMIRALHGADALLVIGLELEIGWLPLLLENARNPDVQPGRPGFVEASAAVAKLGVRTGDVDRSMGDVHAGGNPHVLLDPLCALQVAALLRDRFAELRPRRAEELQTAYAAFRARLCAAMVGPEIARLYDHDAERLGLLFERGELATFLAQQGDRDALGGWCARLRPYRGAKVAADHDLWPYFARRFGIEVVVFLEPKPGIAPTTRHLQEVIAQVRRDRVRAILSAPYFATAPADLVARETGARIARMAHQTGARPGCDDYLETVGHNVEQLAVALAGAH